MNVRWISDDASPDTAAVSTSPLIFPGFRAEGEWTNRFAASAARSIPWEHWFSEYNICPLHLARWSTADYGDRHDRSREGQSWPRRLGSSPASYSHGSSPIHGFRTDTRRGRGTDAYVNSRHADCMQYDVSISIYSCAIQFARVRNVYYKRIMSITRMDLDERPWSGFFHTGNYSPCALSRDRRKWLEKFLIREQRNARRIFTLHG